MDVLIKCENCPVDCMQICSLMRGGIAERGGVRVGHRIIEINSQSVVAMPHEKIVQILSNAMGEVGGALSMWEIKIKHNKCRNHWSFWTFCCNEPNLSLSYDLLNIFLNTMSKIQGMTYLEDDSQ